jgi:hypothetical protein
MFSKAVFGSAALLAAIASQAHAAKFGFSPGLGVKGNFNESDVQVPSSAQPCGNASLADIDSSKSVTASADGSFTVTLEVFNRLIPFSNWPFIS